MKDLIKCYPIRVTFICLMFLVSNLVTAQSVYSNALEGQDPAQMIRIDNYLYVGTGGGIIYRIDLTDPSPTTAEMINNPTGSFAFAFDHYPANNSLYVGDFTSNIYRYDLDDSLPISPTLVVNPSVFASSIIIVGDTLYFSGFGSSTSIRTMDLTDSSPSLEIFYTSTFDFTGFPAFYEGDIFINQRENFDANHRLVRISSIATPEVEEIVIPDLEGTVLGGFQFNEYLYLSVQGPGTDHVVRVDLSEETPTAEVIFGFTSPTYSLGITSYEGQLYVIDNDGLIYTFDDPVLSTTENKAPKLQVYPNPTQGIVSISGLDFNLDYNLFSLDGRLLMSGMVRSNQDINIGNLSSGSYLLEFINGSNRVVKRVVKQ